MIRCPQVAALKPFIEKFSDTYGPLLYKWSDLYSAALDAVTNGDLGLPKRKETDARKKAKRLKREEAVLDARRKEAAEDFAHASKTLFGHIRSEMPQPNWCKSWGISFHVKS